NVPINCGQFAVWQCQLPTFNLSGNFACQGNGCVNPIPMNWVLTHPILGVVNQGSMTGPGFLVSIPSSSFPNPGVYNLLLSGICGTDTCYCEIKIETPGCGNDCTCAMPNAFTNLSYKPNSGPNVPINCGQFAVWQCQFPTFNLGGNFACQGNGCANPIPMNWVLIHPILGVVDQGPMTGPNFSVSIPNSSFPNPGVYTLLLSGICGTDTCYCEIKIETPGCGNGCACGEVTWAQIFKTWDWNSPIKCNNAANPVVVPCLKNGQNYFIHGDFTCSSSNCATGAVTWVLDRPNPLTNVSGTATGPYPHFDIMLLGSYFTQPGVYQLTVSRTCGTTTCSCTFYFEVRSCPCDCDSLPPVALQGFNVSGSIFNCKRTFTPAAQLCSNDQVYWFVNFSLAGTTTGSTPFMYNFATGGSYWVCMLVVRTDPSTGAVCEHYVRCRYIKVKCLTINDPHECANDVVKNGLFNEGVTPGELDGEGSINNWEWFPNTGNGAVFADSTAGANDDGALVFSGGLDNFGAVYQQVDLAPEGFMTLDFFYRNMLDEALPAGTVLEFRLHSEPVPGSPNQVLHTEPVSSDTSAGGWQNRFVSKQYAVNPDYKYLIVCVRNQDSERQSLVALDNLVICSSSAQLTETDEADKALQIRLFPNPNTGEFTVELSETATAKHSLRIVNLTGQVLYDAPAQEGQSQQNIRTRDLPAGLYFLQVLHEGRLIATKKFVRSE
ncbi:MAG: T9SS type A sorting domain-containing protein, partial [Saprospiraceae bacterium]|nr:T9SS type A sorting domain-containing protein [Saprospiraceae bacterium]